MLTQEQINQDWTVRSDNYNRYVEEEFATERPAKWLERIEKNAPSGRPLKILDAGCGPGFFSVLLSRAGHQVTGIDGSEGMLEHARENARRFEVVPELVQGDFVCWNVFLYFVWAAGPMPHWNWPGAAPPTGRCF